MKALLPPLATALALSLLSAAAAAEDSPAAAIRKLTGADTRLVWLRGTNGRGRAFGPAGGGDRFYTIVALDTDENGGKERGLVPEAGSWSMPMITPTGRQVVWSDGDKNVWIADWSGQNRRVVMQADTVVGVAENPVGVEWVYVAEGKNPNGEGYLTIARHRLDKPQVREVVWSNTPAIGQWGFTRDGKYGASRFPANVASVALPNGEMQIVSDYGCTPCLSNDLKNVIHMITVTHNGFHLYNRDRSNHRTIYFDQGPPGKGEGRGEFYWTAYVHYDPRFITFSGPFIDLGSDHPGQLWFCMLDQDSTKIVEWIPVSDAKVLNTAACGWIDPERFGAKPTDKIPVELLEAQLKELAKAETLKPGLDKLGAIAAEPGHEAKAGEARRIIDHVTAWGAMSLQQCRELEATDLPAAIKRYQELATRYAGLAVGDAAAKRLTDDTITREVEAWKHVTKILAAEQALTHPETDKHPPPAKAQLSAIDEALSALRKDYPGSKALVQGEAAQKRVQVWQKAQLQAAADLEGKDPGEAEAVYKDLAGRFTGTDTGQAARARLDDKAFKKQVEAWGVLKKMQELEKSFTAIPGAVPKATDAAWLKPNKPVLDKMKSLAKGLQQRNAETVAWTKAQALLAQYDIVLK